MISKKLQVILTPWKQQKENCQGTAFMLYLLHTKLIQMGLYEMNDKRTHNALLDSAVLKYTNHF